MIRKYFAVLLLVAFVMLLFPNVSFALTSGDFEYIDNLDGTATITTYLGNGGAVTIAATVPNEAGTGTCDVTSISDYSFSEKGITSISIPNSIKTIGIGAFKNNSLDNITIGNNVISIGESAFSFNSINSITIGNGVTSIGSMAFNNNKITMINGSPSNGIIFARKNDGTEDTSTIVSYGGTAVDIDFIPNSVTTIDQMAFYYSGLESVIIPDSVITLNWESFASNPNLTSLSIGDSVRTIGVGAFQGDGLLSITIPDSVKTIDGGAFSYNHNLERVTIGRNVTTMFYDTFQECSKLVIKCYADSYAHEYAINNSILFELMEDNIPPEIIAHTPDSNAISISKNTFLSIEFNEKIQAGTGDIIIKEYADNSVVETFVLASNSNITFNATNTGLTITPSSDLEKNTKYYVEISNTAIRDLSDNYFEGIDSKDIWCFTTGDNVDFDCANLKQALIDNGADTNLDGNISEGEMEALTGALVLSNKGITDLTGIEYAVNVQTITLSQNSITDLENGTFSGFSSLLYLHLGDNQISDIESGDFTGLNSLEFLYLNGNPINDLENGDFTGLSSLVGLDLDYTQINSIESGDFTGINSLQLLSLSGTAINFDNIDFNGLNSLMSLYLNDCQINSISSEDLNGLNSLNEIWLENNNIASIASVDLCDIDSLSILNLASNNITNLYNGDFVGYESLGELILASNNISSIESGAFAGLDDLGSLSMFTNPVSFTDIDITSPPTKLTYDLGDLIDLTGMIITANYTGQDSHTISNSDVNILNFDNKTSGVQTITVKYAADSKTFDITMTENDARLSNLVISESSLNPSFDSSVVDYTVNVGSEVHSIELTPTVNDSSATITVDGADVPSGTAKTINLVTGDKVINIVVTGSDGITQKTYTVVVTKAASADAKLSDLIVSKGSLSPAFDSDKTQYNVDVGCEVNSIDITPTANENNATIKMNGNTVASGSAKTVNLATGDNEITILVTAEDGVTTQEYAVIVAKAASADAKLSNLTISQGTLAPTFDSDIIDYTTTVSNSVNHIDIVPTLSYSKASIKVNDAVVNSGASKRIELKTGENRISILVTAEDGVTTMEYTVVVTKLPSTDATLSNLLISEGGLTPSFNKYVTNYSTTVGYKVDLIQITPYSGHDAASIKVNGGNISSGSSKAINLEIGQNEINVEVTAEDGVTKKVYTIDVNVIDTRLSDLSISEGALSPSFDSDTTDYTVSVNGDVYSIHIMSTVNDSSATITVDGADVPSGTAKTINLVTGDKVINIVVTGSDGITQKTYTVVVTKAASADAKLSGLTVSEGSLSPAFESNKIQYDVSVGYAVNSISITPTANEQNATIKVNGNLVVNGSAKTVNLVTGDNEITILVTAEDGVSTKEYTVIVAKAASIDAKLSNLTISQGTLAPTFDSDIIDYITTVGNSVNHIDIVPTVSDTRATIKVNDSQAVSGTSKTIELKTGENKITVLVTAEDGVTKKKYTIVITKLPSTDATLSNLSISEGSLTPSFNKYVTNYTATFGYEVDVIKVTPVASHGTTSIIVNGSTVSSGSDKEINLEIGQNEIDITVTAEDGITQKIYTIIITREMLKKPTASTIRTSKSEYTTDERVRFYWTEAERVDTYEIRIFKDTSSVKLITTITGISISYTVSEPGEYTAEIYSCNAAGKTKGNMVSFLINEPAKLGYIDTLRIDKNTYNKDESVLLSWNYCKNATEYKLIFSKRDQFGTYRQFETVTTKNNKYVYSSLKDVGNYIVKICAINNSETKAGNTVFFMVKEEYIKVERISINKNNIVLNVIAENGYRLYASIYPSNSSNKEITWESSDSTVASVNCYGEVTPRNIGIAKITSKSGDGVASQPCVVTVAENVNSKTMYVKSDSMTVFIQPSTYSTKVITLHKSDSAIVTKHTYSKDDGQDWVYITFVDAKGVKKSGWVRYNLLTDDIYLDPNYNPTKTEIIKTQNYLNDLGFGVGSADGKAGMKTTTAIIYYQYYKGFNITGKTCSELIKQLEIDKKKKLTYRKIRNSSRIKNWKPKAPVVPIIKTKNGHYNVTNFITIPGNAKIDVNMATAWAMMVMDAKEAGLSVYKFQARGPNCGYRTYDKQVEAYYAYRANSKMAARPRFYDAIFKSYKGSSIANEAFKAWMNNKSNIKKYNLSPPDKYWDNIPDRYTADGYILAGYGTSNHGYGLAIDMKFGKTNETSKEYIWLKKNANKYGLSPYEHECWHWNYTKR